MSETIKQKKNNKNLEQELLNSLKENDEKENTDVDITKVIEPGEAMGLINSYEELIKNQCKRVILYVAKQGDILKNVKHV